MLSACWRWHSKTQCQKLARRHQWLLLLNLSGTGQIVLWPEKKTAAYEILSGAVSRKQTLETFFLNCHLQICRCHRGAESFFGWLPLLFQMHTDVLTRSKNRAWLWEKSSAMPQRRPKTRATSLEPEHMSHPPSTTNAAKPLCMHTQAKRLRSCGQLELSIWSLAWTVQVFGTGIFHSLLKRVQWSTLNSNWYAFLWKNRIWVKHHQPLRQHTSARWSLLLPVECVVVDKWWVFSLILFCFEDAFELRFPREREKKQIGNAIDVPPIQSCWQHSLRNVRYITMASAHNTLI